MWPPCSSENLMQAVSWHDRSCLLFSRFKGPWVKLFRLPAVAPLWPLLGKRQHCALEFLHCKHSSRAVKLAPELRLRPGAIWRWTLMVVLAGRTLNGHPKILMASLLQPMRPQLHQPWMRRSESLWPMSPMTGFGDASDVTLANAPGRTMAGGAECAEVVTSTSPIDQVRQFGGK